MLAPCRLSLCLSAVLWVSQGSEDVRLQWTQALGRPAVRQGVDVVFNAITLIVLACMSLRTRLAIQATTLPGYCSRNIWNFETQSAT